MQLMSTLIEDYVSAFVTDHCNSQGIPQEDATVIMFEAIERRQAILNFASLVCFEELDEISKLAIEDMLSIEKAIAFSKTGDNQEEITKMAERAILATFLALAQWLGEGERTY